MMTLQIIVKNKQIAKAIAHEMFNRKLIYNAIINENVTSFEQSGTELIEKSMAMLITTGRAMNYADATVLIKQMFPTDEPVFYSIPVLNYNNPSNNLATKEK